MEELWEVVEGGGKLWENVKVLSKVHDVPAATIVRWFYAAHPKKKCHQNAALSDEQEEQLVFAALAMSHENLDWSAKQLKEAVATMFDIKISLSWTYEFLARHCSNFSFRKPTSLGAKRVGDDLYDDAVNFFERYEQFLEKKPLPSHAFVNYDECRIVINGKSSIEVRRLVSKKKKKPQSKSKVLGTHCGTYLPFIAANGDVLASYFILAMKFDENGSRVLSMSLPSSFAQTRKGTSPPVIFMNESGYLNGEVFSKILDHFTDVWQKRYPGLHCCLIGDNLAAHRDVQLIAMAMQRGVYMTYLPAGTTHWSQPLDNLLFARLKQEVAILVRNISLVQVFTEEMLFSLVDIVLRASKVAFTSRAITHSFRETGLFPPSKRIFLELASLNHHPSKAGESESRQEDTIVQKVVEGLEKCLEEVKKDVQAASQNIRPVRVRVRKNAMYFADDILAESKRQKEDEEKGKKEKELEREKKRGDWKRKREEAEKKKEENARLCEERKVKKARELEKQLAERATNTCKASCGRICRGGGGWLGCINCDVFWICPDCALTAEGMEIITKHEEGCSA